MVYEVLNNIHKAQELLTDLNKRIERDMECSKVKQSPNGYSFIDNKLRSSKADIERVCKMARSILKDCYGDSSGDYYTEIKEIVIRMGGRK